MHLRRSARSALTALDQQCVWLNSERLTVEGLGGRVVLVDFWTYSCVNWLRTLPYVRAWAEKYVDRGLTVVGVHAPEFGFEHDLGNVRRAVADLKIAYPVVIDNEYAVWRAFDNHYWPALYLVDGGGHVRFHHFGEEAYAETERAIQSLLETNGELVDVSADGVFEPADWSSLRSPETYVGRSRGLLPSGLAPDQLRLNQWTVTGAWSFTPEYAVIDASAGTIAYRFQGRDLNLVLATTEPVGFTVLLDGEPPGDHRGVDVDRSGRGVAREPRMYQLVRARGAACERTVEVRFDGPGVRAYVFTFG